MLGPLLLIVLVVCGILIKNHDSKYDRWDRLLGKPAKDRKKAVRKAMQAVKRTIRELREDRREFKEAMQEARWEAREARLEKAAERFDAVMTGIGALGEKCARKTEEGVRALKDGIEARKAIREQMKSGTIEEAQTEPVIPVDEALMNRIIVRDLEKDAARTATMAANVPTIEFPEEDDKYFSSRKYESADD
jgi:hypothetical protein